MTWTASVMPDDALPPDSLVGKMLNPEPPSWQEWPGGECPRCGYHDLEIQNTAEHGWATDGDPIRCKRCGLVGWMNVDAEDACDEMFPDDYEDLPDDWESPPPLATVEPMPLWRVMERAHEQEAGSVFDHLGNTVLGEPDRFTRAAEIEALRDYIVPEEPEPTPLFPKLGKNPVDDIIYSQCAQRQHLRALLTAQARIARGEQP